MKYLRKKDNIDIALFEDAGYPKFIDNIKSVYWYRQKGDNKRINISLSQIDCQKRGLEIIHEKATNRYFVHYPVDVDWFPESDRRTDNQGKFTGKENRVIALDPGIRKFLVGYDPTRKSIVIAEIAELLLEIDKTDNPVMLWLRLKNMISEMHWKSISYLMQNYDTILYPDFRISQMVKGHKLSKMVKRLLYSYSFHSFKEKLVYKCKVYGKRLYIVDESYTSCTCTVCGTINRMQGVETYTCSNCRIQIDRDLAGSRNIYIKNTVSTLGTLNT